MREDVDEAGRSTAAVGEHVLVEGARPAGLALSLLEKRTSLVKVARPICMAIDRVAPPNRFQLKAKVAAHNHRRRSQRRILNRLPP